MTLGDFVKNRYVSSLLITSAIYSGLVATYLFSFDGKQAPSLKQKSSNQNVSFTILAQEKSIKEFKKTEPKKIEKPQKVTKKKIIPKKEPIEKEKPKKKIVPKKVEKPKEKIEKQKEKIVKKIVPKKVEKPIKEIVKKVAGKRSEQKTEPKQQLKSQVKKTITKTQDNSINEAKLKAKKDNYFTIIKQSIEKNKIYPKVAIRRGIEGVVKVKFTISKNGELLSLDIIDGKTIFKKSIVKAFEDTFPIKPEDSIFTSNSELSLTLEYKLY